MLPRTLKKIAYTAVSSSTQSRFVGRLSEIAVPRSMMPLFLRAYCARYGVDLSEAVVPEGGFGSFNSFFTRRLRPGARPVDPSPGVMVSPCDGTVQTCGEITRGMLFQAKGREYRLDDLLGGCSDGVQGSSLESSGFEGGRYLTIYLSPGDYHRVHFPFSGRVRRVSHIPGGLFSVAPGAAAVIDRLFCRNERVSGLIETDAGDICMVMVGATSVGRISLQFADVVSNCGRHHGVIEFPARPAFEKGDEYGVFNLGSTVILLTGPGRWLPVHPEVGGKLRQGAPVFRRS